MSAADGAPLFGWLCTIATRCPALVDSIMAPASFLPMLAENVERWLVSLPILTPASRSYAYMSSYSVPLLCPSMRLMSSWTSGAISFPNTFSTFFLYDFPPTLPMSTSAILSASLLAAAIARHETTPDMLPCPGPRFSPM